MKLIECVPNFSEGRNKSKIDEIIASIKESSQTTILDVDMGFDTNRTVITIIGSPSEVLNGVFNGIKKASKIIDMRKHTGTHPRIGSTDVLPSNSHKKCKYGRVHKTVTKIRTKDRRGARNSYISI